MKKRLRKYGPTINIYCDEKLKALIEKIALKERRSVSGQILMIIEKWLEGG